MNDLNVDVEEVAASAVAVGDKTLVQLPGDNRVILEFIRELAPLLLDKGLYRRDTIPVIAYAERRRLEILSVSAFRSWIEQHVQCYKTRYDKKGKPFNVSRSMPGDVADATLASWQFFAEMPNVTRLNTVPKPVYRASGSMELLEDGFDKESGTLTFKAESPYKIVSLLEATDYIRNLLKEFPFSDWKEVPLADEDGGGVLRQSRGMAIQLASMLSQFVDQLVPAHATRMGFIWNANTPRSGKTLLAKIAIIASSGTVAIQSWNAKDEELKKVLDAEVLRASSYIFFDNIRGHIASQVLEGFVTAAHWTGRVLGQSKMFTAENTVTLFLTGNDCTVSADMAYRCLVGDLFVEEANAGDRSIKEVIGDSWLVKWENRHAILSALWSIVRHWDAAGRPPPKATLRAGFEEWSMVIGGIVEFAGFGNCFEEITLDMAGDTETADMRALVKHLYSLMQEGESQIELTFQRMVNLCHEQGLFDWLLDGKMDDDNDYVLNPKSNGKFAKVVHRFAPLKERGRRVFRLALDLRVGLHVDGKHRHRRYVLSIVQN